MALERRELVTRGITGPPEVLSTSVICRRATVRWRPGAAPPWRSERRTVGSARPAAEDGGDVPAYRGHVDGNVPPAHPTGLGYHVGPELGPHVVYEYQRLVNLKMLPIPAAAPRSPVCESSQLLHIKT